MLKNDRFIKACWREKVDYTPIWLMRQAGRILKGHQDLWKKYDFMTLCKTPSLAAEITIFPVRFLGVDAAILFSDLLVPCEAMGMKLVFTKDFGPKFPEPIKSGKDISKLITPNPYEKMNFVMETIKLTKKGLNGLAPVIGFAGGPFTIAAHMIEGINSYRFPEIKKMLFKYPSSLHLLLEKTTETITDFLNAQIEAGADSVMIFDNCAGQLSPDEYKEFVFPYTTEIIKNLKRDNCPVILYVYGCSHLLELMVSSKPDAISLDEKTDISTAKKKVKGKVALQGNIDALALYSDPETIKKEAKKILEKFGKGNGHIFNVGNALSPDLPVENVKALIEAVHKESKVYH